MASKKSKHQAIGKLVKGPTFGAWNKPKGGVGANIGGIFTGPFAPNPAAAPAAGTPAAPAPTPSFTEDPLYKSGKATLDLNQTNSLGDIEKRRSFLSQTSGFAADGSEYEGPGKDPFSNLARLKGQYEQIKRGSSASYAARGLGYDGAYQNKVSADADNNAKSYNDLYRSWQGSNMALDSEKLGVQNQNRLDMTNLGSSTVTRLADNAATSTDQQAAAQAAQRERDDQYGATGSRKSIVLQVLQTNLTPAVRKRLENEAKQKGWI